MNFVFLSNTKDDILKKVCNQAVLGHQNRTKIKYYGSQWCPRTALFPTFFRISSFVFSRTKTFTQVWNYTRVSQWWQNFHFWVNYPFKLNKNYSKYIYSKMQQNILFQTIQLNQIFSRNTGFNHWNYFWRTVWHGFNHMYKLQFKNILKKENSYLKL